MRDLRANQRWTAGRGGLAAAAIAAGTLSSSCVDLVVRNVRDAPASPTTRVLQAEVANQGDASATATRTAVLTRASRDQPYVERVRVATPALAGGASTDLRLWDLPAAELPRAGDCLHVKVCADADGEVREWRDGNNCAELSLGNDAFCPSVGPCCASDLPASFDWRSWNGTNWVTPVRDQAGCGSCWAFSATAVVESAARLQRSGSPSAPGLDLSEQQLVTCGRAGDCLGGWVEEALDFIRTDSMVSEATFPYQCQACVTGSGSALSCAAGCSCPAGGPCATPCSCSWAGSPPAWRIGRYQWVDVSASAEKIATVKRALVCRGPLAVCSASWWHCVLLVGWQAATPFRPESWVVKNSWGTGWAGGGFGTIPVAGDPRSDLVDFAYFVEDVR